MEEQRLGVGVVEEVDELVLEVPVVHVHRDAAHLERRVQALEVLVAVVEVRRDLGARLRARPRPTPAARRAARSSNSVHVRRRSPCTIATRSGSASATDSHERREVPVHGVSPRSVVARRAVSQPRYRGRMPPRGGQQRIPRPPSYRPGRPAPWAHVDPTDRRLTLDDVRARLAAARRPARRAGAARAPGSVAAAVLVPLFEADGDVSVILTKRPETMPSHQGEIAFPGGKHDPVARPRPPGHGAAGGAGGDRTRSGRRSRSWPGSKASRPSRRGS